MGIGRADRDAIARTKWRSREELWQKKATLRDARHETRFGMRSDASRVSRLGKPAALANPPRRRYYLPHDTRNPNRIRGRSRSS